MATTIHKLLIVIRIRFQGVQGYELMNFWTDFLLKKIGAMVENNDLVFSLPYPKHPRETVLFFGADSSGSLSRLDESFLRASLDWTGHLNENERWELDWDLSVYDFLQIQCKNIMRVSIFNPWLPTTPSLARLVQIR